jgi:hypothetical protein
MVEHQLRSSGRDSEFATGGDAGTLRIPRWLEIRVLVQPFSEGVTGGLGENFFAGFCSENSIPNVGGDTDLPGKIPNLRCKSIRVNDLHR